MIYVVKTVNCLFGQFPRFWASDMFSTLPLKNWCHHCPCGCLNACYFLNFSILQFEVTAGTLPLVYSTLQDPLATTKDEYNSFVPYILYHSWSIETADHFPFLISHTEVALKSRLSRKCFIKWCSAVCNNWCNNKQRYFSYRQIY